MEFQKVLETRRTVRKYSAGVTREQMEELLRAAQGKLHPGKTPRPAVITVSCQKRW